MTFKIIFSILSKNDLESIIDYYYNLNINTSKKYYKEIYDKIKILKEFPEIGRIVPEFQDLFYNKYRVLIYENYRIIYKIIKNDIIIVRIIDGRRLLELDMLE